MKSDQVNLSGIVDIEFAPPVTPPTDPFWVGTIIVLALLVAVGLFLWAWNSNRFKNLRRLKQLKQSWNRQQLDAHQTAFKLAALLRSSFQIGHLSINTPLPSKLQQEHDRWKVFNELLADARYAANSPSRSNIDKLLQESRYWLRHWQ